MYGHGSKHARKIQELTAHRDNLSAKYNRHAAGCARCRVSLFEGDMCDAGRMLKGEHETAAARVIDEQAEAAREAVGGGS